LNRDIQLVSPFPRRDCGWLWRLLNEAPAQNLDDTSPTSAAGIKAEVIDRETHGEMVWQVVQAGQKIGVIGYARINDEWGSFHGISFTKKVHGTGAAIEAVSMVLRQVFASGVKKVMAVHFEDNHQVWKFLQKLGARENGIKHNHTPRGGVKVNVRVATIDAVHFRDVQGLRLHRAGVAGPAPVGCAP
jgi:RimJ/RimL family protein N-acetyltransferase